MAKNKFQTKQQDSERAKKIKQCIAQQITAHRCQADDVIFRQCTQCHPPSSPAWTNRFVINIPNVPVASEISGQQKYQSDGNIGPTELLNSQCSDMLHASFNVVMSKRRVICAYLWSWFGLEIANVSAAIGPGMREVLSPKFLHFSRCLLRFLSLTALHDSPLCSRLHLQSKPGNEHPRDICTRSIFGRRTREPQTAGTPIRCRQQYTRHGHKRDKQHAEGAASSCVQSTLARGASSRCLYSAPPSTLKTR